MTSGGSRPRAACHVLGVPVHPVTQDQVLTQIADWLGPQQTEGDAAPPLRRICTVNPEFIMTARQHPVFRAVLCASDLNVPDGIGVAWAMRLPPAGRSVTRVTGADLVPRMAQAAAARGWRLLLLGAGPGVAERAAAQLRQRCPGLIVRGLHGGTPRTQDWPQVKAALAAFQPHILLVAFGHPQQDIWIEEHRADLSGMVAMGIGGTLDFLAGEIRRAPAWMRRLGLEWLFRLLLQPWRLGRMSRLPVFGGLVLWQALQECRRP